MSKALVLHTYERVVHLIIYAQVKLFFVQLHQMTSVRLLSRDLSTNPSLLKVLIKPLHGERASLLSLLLYRGNGGLTLINTACFLISDKC